MARKKIQRSEESSSLSKSDLDLALTCLFEAVEGSNDEEDETTLDSPRPFVRVFVSSNSSKSIRDKISMREQKQLLFQVIQDMNKTQARRFFAALNGIVANVITGESYVPESAYDETREADEVLADPKSTESLQFLDYASQALKTYVAKQIASHSNKKSELAVIEEAYQVALALHDILFSLNSCGPDGVAPQTNIVAVCETMWLGNVVGKEALVLQALPLLVYATLEEESMAKSQVKRLFQIREAFDVIDFGDDSSRSLQTMLLRVASSPICLKQTEGRRFVSFLMATDANFMMNIHRAIKVQIPDAKKSILEAYGEIYFQAWTDAEDEMRTNMEKSVILDLMSAAIHGAKLAVVRAVLVVLEPFHSSKKVPEVERLLYRMYRSTVHRSLRAVNASVRLNATNLFVRVFPLLDGTHADTQEQIADACQYLRRQLVDDDSRVRVAAADGVAQILGTYWETIPATEIRAMINHIVVEQTSDVSSTAVRVAAVNAITALLETNETHAVLRPLLPSVGNLIHDKVEKVRLAVAQMLLKIKKTPGIKYYHVVPVQHLTSRLADEGRTNLTGPVASALTALMVNSYFPQGPNVTGTVQANRTLSFLRGSPAAAAVFYTNLSTHLSVEAVSKLIAMLLRCIQTAVETEQGNEGLSSAAGKKRRKASEVSTSDKGADDVDETENVLCASDTALMAALSETISILWESIEGNLRFPEFEICNQLLMQSFSGEKMLDMLCYFEQRAVVGDELVAEDSHRTCASILRCAGNLPAEAVDGLVPHISKVLASLDSADQGASPGHVTGHIAVLCLWDFTEQVATSLAKSIESTFELDHDRSFASPDATSGKRKSGRTLKKSVTQVMPELPPRVALAVLGYILRGGDPSSVTIRESIFRSSSASNAIEKALELGTKYAERLLLLPNSDVMLESEVEYILGVCEAYGRFALHKEASQTVATSFGPGAKLLIDWTTNVVVRALLSEGRKVEPFEDLDLSRISVEKSFDILPLSPIPTGPPRRRSNRNTTPSRESLFSPELRTINETSNREIQSPCAKSLINSCVILFSEWLAVGGAGATEISKAATSWMKIFDQQEDHDETNREIVPAFCRLALQLCKQASDFSLLRALLVAIKDDIGAVAEIPVTLAVSSLLSGRGASNGSLVSDTVQCVLDASYLLIEDSDDDIVAELPSALNEIWTCSTGCVGSALQTLFMNKNASLELAKLLLSRLNHHDNCTEKASIFSAKCLWVLCDSKSPATEDVINLIRNFDLKEVDAAKSGLRSVLEGFQSRLE